MEWLFAVLAGVGFVELLLRLPAAPTLARLRATLAWVARVLGSARISDHWKERALPRYARRLLLLSLLLGLCLAGACGPFLLFQGASLALGLPFLEFSLSVTGLAFMTLVSAAYAGLRVRLA